MSPVRLLTAIVTAVLASSGCSFGTDIDHPITGVIALRAHAGGGVEACASYQHEHDIPTEGEDWSTRTRIVDLDAGGHPSDRDGSCTAVTTDPSHVTLVDGGRVDLAPLDAMLTRRDASGALLWTAPSPFGSFQATVEDEAAGVLYLGQGPEVAKLMLSDGSVPWVVELR